MSGISGGTAKIVIRMPLPASQRRAMRLNVDATDLSLPSAGSGDRIRASPCGFLKAAKPNRSLFLEERIREPQNARKVGGVPSLAARRQKRQMAGAKPGHDEMHRCERKLHE